MKRSIVVCIWILGLALAWPAIKPLVMPDRSAEAVLGRMPVLEGGRVKPLDAVARQQLLVLHGKQSVRADGKRVSAAEWMLDMLFNRQAARGLPVFRIDHPDILGMFGLETGTKKYFSYADLEPYLSRIESQARKIESDSRQRSPYEAAIYRLYGDLITYQLLSQTVYPLAVSGDVPGFYNAVAAGVLETASRFAGSGQATPERFTTAQTRALMRQVNDMAQSPLFLVHDGTEFKTPGALLTESVAATGSLPPQLQALARLAEARQKGDAEAFAAAAGELAALAPTETGERPGLEYYFGQAHPFIVALNLYVLAMLLVFLGWQFSPSLFLQPAFGILCLGFVIHTAGLVLRVLITGYAPVTNLYSSAVSVGWVAVILSMVFEYLQRKGIGSLAAATIGFLTLLVAHHLADSGDTMEKMRAVLNSNFWLSTHVITIIMGYGATFLAGFLAIIYILYGWFRRGLSGEMQKSFHRMIYGGTCFALLFSFVGTVLGGIWADQSWGRFWGWDPKENGALMIVLWTALTLHALRGGLVRTRGLVNLAIGGNVITAWSWFGTNMLGVGLHSYGFMDSAFFWLVMFWLSQFAFILLEQLFPVRVRAEA